MLNRLRTALTRLPAAAKQAWHWMTTDDGPWNYAGCCGCGRTVVDVFLVISDNGRLRPYEMYCRACWDEKPIAWHDHIWFAETLVSTKWEFAEAIAARAIEQREATPR
jgi:hypothetical protein